MTEGLTLDAKKYKYLVMDFRILTPLLFGFLLVSCSSTSVQHDFDPQVDLASYSSFGVLPNPHPVNDSMAMSVLGYDDIPILVAVSVLEQKGFVREDSETVDFFVGVRTKVVVNGRASYQSLPSGNDMLVMSGWDPGGMMSKNLGQPAEYKGHVSDTSDPGERYGDPSKSHSRKIYLFVDVFDAVSRDLVWQGWTGSGSLSDFDSDSKRAKKIESILETFPN